MDESWNHLQNLEAHIKEHNTHIEKLTPLRTRHHSRQSSIVEETTKRAPETSLQQKMLSMAKELKDKEREISYLKRDVATLEIYKDQCSNMQIQIKLLREKAVICEREAQHKSYILASIETNTVPKLEKLENELKESSAINEKLQKAYSQAKKEADEKISLMSNLKQTYSGQDSSIKALEEEKRNLKIKFSELQTKHEDLLRQHDKNLENLKHKDQLTLALEEDNDRLRTQIENTMESLQKCQYELGLLPKLRQDIHQREQLISAAAREIEKEKNAKMRANEEKEKIETQYANIIECTKGAEPIGYIQELKALVNKSANDHSVINEELIQLKKNQRYNDIETTQTLQYLINYIENISRNLPEEFLKSKCFDFPESDTQAGSVLNFFCSQLQKCQQICLERIEELEEANAAFAERISRYEKNIPLRQKIEEMEARIQGQEELSDQLTDENLRLKIELESRNKEINQTEMEKHQLADEIEQLKNEIENLEINIKENLIKMHYGEWEEE